ncbi:MAG: hypothetical protein CM15mP102_21540 [Flavobacteriales bacterium]|nr:MAG: hypothetical protein CM15mP102_21540 [Flavobacteriales bacterium]
MIIRQLLQYYCSIHLVRNFGGIIELYYEENIQRKLIKNNGEISNEILSY